LSASKGDKGNQYAAAKARHAPSSFISVLENIRPMTETAPLAQAEQAYSRMMEGKARFRMVLITRQ
jgi:hypothetical protein